MDESLSIFAICSCVSVGGTGGRKDGRLKCTQEREERVLTGRDGGVTVHTDHGVSARILAHIWFPSLF